MGKKPKLLTFEEAAGVALVGLTAWEGMVEQMGIILPETESQKQKNQKWIFIVQSLNSIQKINPCHCRRWRSGIFCNSAR